MIAERVTVQHSSNDPGGWLVMVDGKPRFGGDGINRSDAEIYRRGLIAEPQIRQLREALELFLNRHIELVESGDCGCWDPEEDREVQQAREALAATEPKP